MLMHEKHIIVAKQNEKLLEELDDDQFLNWKYVVLYYAALHYGDSYVAKNKGPISFDNHGIRKQAYAKCKIGRKEFAAYARLEEFSRIARYNPDWKKYLSAEHYNKLHDTDFTLMKNLVSG